MNTKVNITLDEDLMKRVDAYADDNYLTRSGLVSLALTQFLNQYDVCRAITDISVSMRKISENKKLSSEEIDNLRDFETLAKMLARQ